MNAAGPPRRPRRPPAPAQPPTEPLSPRVSLQRRHRTGNAGAQYDRSAPEPLRPASWWENPWPAIAAGVVALVAGGLLGFVVGDKSETSRAPAVTRTVTNTTTVVHRTTVVQADTVTGPAAKEPPSPPGAAEDRRHRETKALHEAEQETRRLRHQLQHGGGGP
jgi:hypothetical protein